jgi:hypothetical protein
MCVTVYWTRGDVTDRNKYREKATMVPRAFYWRPRLAWTRNVKFEYELIVMLFRSELNVEQEASGGMEESSRKNPNPVWYFMYSTQNTVSMGNDASYGVRECKRWCGSKCGRFYLYEPNSRLFHFLPLSATSMAKTT